MTVPEGNSCFPIENPTRHETKVEETLGLEGNKTNCFPRELGGSLSDLLYRRTNNN